MATKSVRHQPVVLLRGYQLFVGVLKLIFFLPSLLLSSYYFIPLNRESVEDEKVPE